MPTDDAVGLLREKITGYTGKPLRIMEVCGTHTHENFRLGIRSLLPESIRLIAGPGCPVCVTPASYIDEALFLAQKGAAVCSFGDLLRVPGQGGTLAKARADGADIRVVYSPLDMLALAKKERDKPFVFLSVGFETTTPICCIAAKKAREEHIENLSLLTANKTMTQAYERLAGSADAFLYPGHVSAITGTAVYKSLLKKGVSGVVAGFTASELLLALAAIIEQSGKERPFFRNCYPRVVTDAGSAQAQNLVSALMEPCDSVWRGLGEIKGSGLKLRESYAEFDARTRFSMPAFAEPDAAGCRCGDVLQGHIEPKDCPLFGKLCVPDNPYGACMVSSEGACAAYYTYSF